MPFEETLHFGKFEFDLKQRRLTGPEGDVPLNLKSAEVLAYLVKRPQQIVSKDELIREVWNETSVTDDALVQRILDIRKALGDSSRSPQFIRTHTKRGYEFVGVPEIGAETAAEATLPIASPAVPRGWLVHAIWTAIVVGGIAAVALYLAGPRQTGASHLSDLKISQLTFLPGMEDYPVFDPSGQRVLYASDESGTAALWVLDRASGDRRKILTDQANLSEPDWTENGDFVAYRSEAGTGGLFVRSLGNGITMPVAPFGHHPRWSEDGKNVVFHSGGGGSEVFVWGLADHALRKVEIREPALINIAHPVWSPEGGYIYFIALGGAESVKASPEGVQLGHQIWRVPAVGGRAKVVTPGTGVLKDGGFDLDGTGTRLVFVGLDRSLWSSRLNASSGTQTQSPERLTLSTQGHQHPRFDREGNIVFSAISSPESLWLVKFSEPLAAGQAPVDSSREFHGRESELDVAHMERLTTGAASVRGPAMAPEHPYIAYFIWQGDRFELWLLNLQTGANYPIGPRDSLSRTSPNWSQDGRAILYTVVEGRRREWRVAEFNSDFTRLVNEHAVTGTPGQPLDGLIRGGFILNNAGNLEASSHLIRVDPSGRYQIQTQKGSGGKQVLTVVREGAPAVSLTPEGHYQSPTWSADGRKIFFQSDRDGWFNISEVDFDPAKGVPAGPPRQVSFFRGSPYLLSDSNLGFAVQPGGLVVPLRENRSDLWVIQTKPLSH